MYIKIPECPIRLSYKSTKNKNLVDLQNYSILIPTLEYHNLTWTWLDLLMAIRNDIKRVVFPQVLFSYGQYTVIEHIYKTEIRKFYILKLHTIS